MRWSGSTLFANNNFFITVNLYRGSYMSVYLLSFLINELTKINKMRALASILLILVNEFIKNDNK